MKKFALLTPALFVPALAQAADPAFVTDATTAITGLATTAGTILGAGVALLAAFAVFKIVKKGISRAS